MKTLTKTIAAITIAASLTGCASNGQSMLGSQAGDYGVLGTIAGVAAGYAGAKALGASNTASRNAAILAGAAGGVMGYQHGKVLDQRAADQANAMAQAQQMAIQRDLQLQAQIRYAQVAVQQQPTMQVPNPQPVVRPVAQALEVPVARIEMLSPKNSLTPKATQTLKYMEQQAKQSNMEFTIFIPASDDGRNDVRVVADLQNLVPYARLAKSPDIKNFILVVQPRA